MTCKICIHIGLLALCSLTSLRGCKSIRTNNGWSGHIIKSMSFNLMKTSRLSLLHTLYKTKYEYSRIRSKCYEIMYNHCHGKLKGLCGSVEIKTDKVMDCNWILQVPNGLCINVTIENFPNGDPFTYDYFSLSIKDRNESVSTHGITFYLNQQFSDVITNNSQSLVNLKLMKLFKVSKLTFHFQAIVCNLKVSYNTITTIHQDGHLYYERC